MKRQHDVDLAAGRGSVALPGALRAKYPNAPYEWAWPWVFRATRFYVDEASGERRRHHLHESVVQRAVKDAVKAACKVCGSKPSGHMGFWSIERGAPKRYTATRVRVFGYGVEPAIC